MQLINYVKLQLLLLIQLAHYCCNFVDFPNSILELRGII